MNAPANIRIAEPTPEYLALRDSVAVWHPGEREGKLHARVQLAQIRDRANAAMSRCGDAAYGIVAEIARQSGQLVNAEATTRQLDRMRIALAFALDAAWALEVAAREYERR